MGEKEEDYEEIRHLGQGAFGEVVLSRRRSDGELCAVKRLRKGAEMTAGEANEHVAEVRALQQLNHPGILRYFGSLQDKDRLSLIMEYADSGDLQQLMRRRADSGRAFFEPMAVLSIFAQIAAAVAHVHLNRVLHRDLKPSNVLLTTVGLVKLGDFGVAKVMAGTTIQAQMTCVGSPTYMAPEIVGGEPYGRACDVWSLGVVFYELCSFKRPFEGRSLGELIMRVASGKYEALSGRVSGPAGESLVATATPLVERMLVVEPSRRATMPHLVVSPPLDLLVLSQGATTATVASLLREDEEEPPQQAAEGDARGLGTIPEAEGNATVKQLPQLPPRRAASPQPNCGLSTVDSFALSLTGASSIQQQTRVHPDADISFALTPSSTVRGPSPTLAQGASSAVRAALDLPDPDAGGTVLLGTGGLQTLMGGTIGPGADEEPGLSSSNDANGLRDILQGAYHDDDECEDADNLRDILHGAYHDDDECEEGPGHQTSAFGLGLQGTLELDACASTAPLEPEELASVTLGTLGPHSAASWEPEGYTVDRAEGYTADRAEGYTVDRAPSWEESQGGSQAKPLPAVPGGSLPGRPSRGPPPSGLQKASPGFSRSPQRAARTGERWSGGHGPDSLDVGWSIRTPGQEADERRHSMGPAVGTAAAFVREQRLDNSGGSSRSDTPNWEQHPEAPRQPARHAPSRGSEDLSPAISAKRGVYSGPHPPVKSPSSLVHAGSLSVFPGPQRISPVPWSEDADDRGMTVPSPLAPLSQLPHGRHLMRATTPPAGKPSLSEAERARRKEQEQQRERERDRMRAAASDLLTIPFNDRPEGAPAPAPPQRFLERVGMHDERQKQRVTPQARTAPAASLEGQGGQGRQLSSSSSKRSNEHLQGQGGRVVTLHAAPLSGPRSCAVQPAPRERR